MPARRTREDELYEERKRKRIIAKLFGLIFLILFVTIGGTIAYYALTIDLPGIDTLKDYRPIVSSIVYDDKDKRIDNFFVEDRKVIAIKEIPKSVKNAFIAAEDSRFYEHKGFDIQSIFRAMIKNFEAGYIVQGGSTITQQVAKLIYLSPEKKYMRKVKEAILSYKIDRYLTKDEILSLYLNQIYLGHGTYGIEAAALGYFGKSAKDLTLPEAALLAGMPKAPSTYSPYLYFERSKQRQAYVLSRMVEEKYITQQEMDRAVNEPLILRDIKPKEKVAAYFIEHIRRYVQEKYGADILYKEGLSIYTTLNLEAQIAAREAMEKGLSELEDRQKFERGSVQGAIYCMDVRTGAIRAMVGGRDFNKSEFNRATQSRRQAGSAFKPLIYTAAFDKGMNPSTQFIDSPLVIEDPSVEGGLWKPQNFDGKFMGPITMHTALVQSRNVVTIKILQEIGIDYAVSYAMNMGITSPIPRSLSMALGTTGVTLQEMVNAYGVLANGGKKVTPYFIKKIVDRTGTVFEESTIKSEQVIDERIAFLASYIMRDVVERGTGSRAKGLGRQVAGKTGTTNDTRDSWFIGFTPSLVAGVWIGFDQEASLGKSEVGGRAAAPIWRDFMQKALQGTPVETFPTPEGIIFVKVDPITGVPTSNIGGGAIYEAFLDNAPPSEKSNGTTEETEDLFR